MDSYGHFVAEFLLLNLFFAEIVTLPGGTFQISRDNLSKKIDSFVFILQVLNFFSLLLGCKQLSPDLSDVWSRQTGFKSEVIFQFINVFLF